MITQQAHFYGAALFSLFEGVERPLLIQKMPSENSCVFVIDHHIPLIVKYSGNRSSPWAFTFTEDHLSQYCEVLSKYGKCIIVLVCGFDGIATLKSDDIECIFGEDKDQTKSIRISRKLNQMYQVTGSNGILDRKISRNSLLIDLLDSLQQGNK